MGPVPRHAVAGTEKFAIGLGNTETGCVAVVLHPLLSQTVNVTCFTPGVVNLKLGLCRLLVSPAAAVNCHL